MAPDSYLMMLLTAGNCRWDRDRLDSAGNKAIDDIEQIPALKITDKERADLMKDYFPKLKFDHAVNRNGTIRFNDSFFFQCC